MLHLQNQKKIQFFMVSLLFCWTQNSFYQKWFHLASTMEVNNVKLHILARLLPLIRTKARKRRNNVFTIMGLCSPYLGAGPFCEASHISDPQRMMGADFCPELSPSWEMIAPPFCDHEPCIFSFLQAIISRQTRTGRDISSALLALYPLSSCHSIWIKLPAPGDFLHLI